MVPKSESDRGVIVRKPNTPRIDDCDVQELSFQNEVGDAMITVFRAFPGIELLYVDVCADRVALCTDTEDTMLEIHYCTEGKLEQTCDMETFTLMPRDLCVSVIKRNNGDLRSPMHLYRGISILIEPECAALDFSQFMEGVDPVLIVQGLCSHKSRRILHCDPRLIHLFFDLLHLPQQNKLGYCRMKVIELFYLLGEIEQAESKRKALTLPEPQVQLAARAADVLAQEEVRSMTVQQLAKKCGASQTYLQTCMKNVFGVTASVYIRKQRMQKAARALASTSKTVMEIAAEAGYENASKFSAAFAKTMGELPTQYRKSHRKQ